MAFKATKWALSNIDIDPDAPIEDIQPEPGYQYLQILGASWDENTARYRLDLKSLTNEAEFRLTYFFSGKDDKSVPPKLTNRKQMGTIASLGKALAGVNISIPLPEDVIGGVVLADVSITESEKDGKVRHFSRVYKFEPEVSKVCHSESAFRTKYSETPEHIGRCTHLFFGISAFRTRKEFHCSTSSAGAVSPSFST